MKCVQILMHDHIPILGALETMECLMSKRELGETVDYRDLETILDFLVEFADRWHHSKEERILFPALVEAGLPLEGGPVGMMLKEHEQGRALLRRLHQALRANAIELFAFHAEMYRRLLVDHIAKEEQILFPMAAGMLSSRDSELAEGMAEIQREYGEHRSISLVQLMDVLATKHRTLVEKAPLGR